MTRTVLITGFVLLAVLVAGGFAVVWSRDSRRSREIATDSARLDTASDPQPTADPGRPTDIDTGTGGSPDHDSTAARERLQGRRDSDG